jgi:hypothetical protein
MIGEMLRPFGCDQTRTTLRALVPRCSFHRALPLLSAGAPPQINTPWRNKESTSATFRQDKNPAVHSPGSSGGHHDEKNPCRPLLSAASCSPSPQRKALYRGQTSLAEVALPRSKLDCPMFAMGQKQTWPHVRSMSALPPKADISLSARGAPLCATLRLMRCSKNAAWHAK